MSFGGEVGTKGYAKATYVRRKTTNIIDDFITADLGSTVVIRDGVNFGEYDNIDLSQRRRWPVPRVPGDGASRAAIAPSTKWSSRRTGRCR